MMQNDYLDKTRMQTGVLPDNIVPSTPSKTALATSVISARVGSGLSAMDASISVAQNTNFPAMLAFVISIFCARDTWRIPTHECGDLCAIQHPGILTGRGKKQIIVMCTYGWSHPDPLTDFSGVLHPAHPWFPVDLGTSLTSGHSKYSSCLHNTYVQCIQRTPFI
jgi:hypothetical protein